MKIEVEEIKFLASGDYEVIVRANRYENKAMSMEVSGNPVNWPMPEKVQTMAEFTVHVPRVARRKRNTERPIREIKHEAIRIVAGVCREICAIPGA